LSPGLANHYDFAKGKTHTMGWGQYKTSDFAVTPVQGTCSLSLADLKPQPTSLCPDSKKNGSDPNRQKDCSPALGQSCYDSTTYRFANSKCPAGNACARWIETSPTGGSFYLDGCLLAQYCGTSGRYKGRMVQFDCPNPPPPVTPVTPPPPVTLTRQGTRCTLQQEDDVNNKKRAPTCSSFRACANQTTNQPDSSSCEANESCAKYAWKGSSGTVYAYQYACVLQKYCGLQDASLSGWDFDGTRYDYTTAFACSGTPQPITPTCPAGQVYTGGACQCPSGQSLVNGQCQAQPVGPTCLPAQFAVNGVCACPPGKTVTQTGLGCVSAPRCFSGQTVSGGQCTCPAGQEIILYEPGCQVRQQPCLTNQLRGANGNCECPPGQVVVQWEPGCFSAGPSCLSGQTLSGGVCTCPPGLVKTNTGTGCQAQTPSCLTGQYADPSTGRCTCPAGQTVV